MLTDHFRTRLPRQPQTRFLLLMIWSTRRRNNTASFVNRTNDDIVVDAAGKEVAMFGFLVYAVRSSPFRIKWAQGRVKRFLASYVTS
jgi:hypothetical protein